MKERELNQAIWMLADAIKNITNALATNNIDSQIEWLTNAIDSMNNAQKNIEKTNILPF